MSLKKGLSIFLLLSVIVSGAILFFSLDKTSLELFRQADFRILGFAMFLVVCVWLLDALKVATLTRAAGEHIPYTLAIELTWINYFGAALTPMQSGGGPFQMYLMYKHGISVGKTVAITLVRTFLTMLILGLTVPFACLLKNEIPEISWGMKGFLFYVVIFIVVAWFCIITSLVRPKIIKRFFGIVIMGLKKLGVLKPERVIAILKRTSREIDAYNQNIWAFLTTGRRDFFFASICAVIQMLTYLSVMPCMIWAMGIEVAYVECVLLQALFIFLLYFMPTPGGSGAAEGGAALVFSVFVPWNVAGMLGVGWRFLTEHTGIVLGTVVALKLIGWSIANQIVT
ncbi:flippase-like domain-containing protein, partial [Synergistaceae bacterium OttesenSCG-928-I11]|nr:flippase-like domain-containing protein [Synergistaceae bacterium OttesenSCG-928-I11]